MTTMLAAGTVHIQRSFLHGTCSIATQMLDLRRLRLLRELDARGTIHGAARALDYTPSAISQQLAVLEREAGRRCSSAPGATCA